MNMLTMMKQPSAFLPVAMSFAALAVVLGHVAMFGVVREADEGTAAHIFQLLLIAQVPIVAFFAIKWLPRNPQPALQVQAQRLDISFGYRSRGLNPRLLLPGS